MERLKHFFEKHGLSKKEVFLHADNYTGQNRNNCYFKWCCMTETYWRHIILSHCRPHQVCTFWICRTKISSLTAISMIVDESAVYSLPNPNQLPSLVVIQLTVLILTIHFLLCAYRLQLSGSSLYSISPSAQF